MRLHIEWPRVNEAGSHQSVVTFSGDLIFCRINKKIHLIFQLDVKFQLWNRPTSTDPSLCLMSFYFFFNLVISQLQPELDGDVKRVPLS